MGAIYSFQSEIEADEKNKHQKHLVCEQIKNSNIKLKPIIPVSSNYKKKRKNNINVIRL
jgi:hypothetical protein